MKYARNLARGFACVAVLALLGACLSDRPLVNRYGFENENADDAVGFVSVSTPLFTPLDAAIHGGKRLDFRELACWQQAEIDLTATSFGIQKRSYDLFSLALAVRLATINQTVIENTTTRVDNDQIPVNRKPVPSSTEGQDPPVTPNTRSTTREFTSPTPPENPPTPPVLNEAIKMAMAEMLGAPDGDNSSYSLPPDVLATLAASLQTYMVNLEEFYNVDGFDYKHGLSGRYVPYKVHFTVTAEPGWYSRYRQYDAIVEVELSLLKDACGGCKSSTGADGASDDIVILHVSPIETAQSITEFSAAMAQFSASVQASGSASSNVAFNAEAQRLSLAAKRLEGARAHTTFTVGFPKANRMRVRFIADRVATNVGRDLQPVSRVLTATVLVPVDAVGRLHEYALESRSPEVVDGYLGLMRSMRTKGSAVQSVRNALAQSLLDIQKMIRHASPRDNDPFLRVVFQQTAEAVRAGETPESILLPFLTLLRQKVPSALGTDAQTAIQELTNKPSVKWSGLFEAFHADGMTDQKVLDAFLLAAKEGTVPASDPVQALAAQIKLVGAEHFPSSPKRVDDALKTMQQKRAWISALTCQVLYRMFQMQHAAETIKSGLDRRSEEYKRALDNERFRVRELLRGTRCALDVKAYFTPTMFGPSGNPAPPRNYFGIIDPPDQRVLAADLKSPRVAPIPPWMGPLDDELAILWAEGTYGESKGDAIAIQRKIASGCRSKEEDDCCAQALADAKARAAISADIVRTHGRAHIRVMYTAPSMILDSQEELIHQTDMYARVVGLGNASCEGESACSGTSPNAPPGICAPGRFCRLLPGRNDTVIEVRDVDLSSVMGTTTPPNGAKPTDAKALRAVLQFMVVPKGMDPHFAWTGGTAQVVSREVLLLPQWTTDTPVEPEKPAAPPDLIDQFLPYCPATTNDDPPE